MFLRIIILSIILALTTGGDLMGQSRKKSTKKKKATKKEISIAKEDQKPFIENLNIDLKIGNVSFWNGLFLSSKANVGYKMTDRFSAGVGGKIFYTQLIVQNGPDFKYTDLGGFIYARGKITQSLYLQMEYHRTKYDPVNFFLPGETIMYPSIGGGYMRGERWKFGIELNLILNDRARDYQNSIIEYWVGASYNF